MSALVLFVIQDCGKWKSFPLDKSYYMGLYFLCFRRYNIRKFVNILPAIFGR